MQVMQVWFSWELRLCQGATKAPCTAKSKPGCCKEEPHAAQDWCSQINTSFYKTGQQKEFWWMVLKELIKSYDEWFEEGTHGSSISCLKSTKFKTWIPSMRMKSWEVSGRDSVIIHPTDHPLERCYGLEGKLSWEDLPPTGTHNRFLLWWTGRSISVGFNWEFKVPWRKYT